MSGEYRFGIEEEYFVNDAAKRDAARSRIPEFFDDCREHIAEDVHREMLEPQVEIATPPSLDFGSAREQLRCVRASLGELAARPGLATMASCTHPLSYLARVRPDRKSFLSGKSVEFGDRPII